MTVRWPAEWEPHRRSFVAWPHDRREWTDALAAACDVVASYCRALAASEPVVLLAPPRAVADLAKVLDHPMIGVAPAEYGDIWLRDTAPIFCRRGADLGAVAFRWTGWGGKFDIPGDDGVAEYIAGLAGAPLTRLEIAAEGGAIEGDGSGLAITTRDCLLNPNRNPGAEAAGIEVELRAALGVTRLVWLDRGLRGDHTDGHVDNIARFVAAGVVACTEPGEGVDPNREIHAEVLAEVRAAGLEVATVPSPGRVETRGGELLAASYLNFYVANDRVLVPQFRCPADEQALRCLEALFPERVVVGIEATALLYGGGALHCITAQEPAPKSTTTAP